MNPHEQLIEEFYAAFAAGNAKTMASCYHQDVVFEDPVFGVLKGQLVSDMWHMLIERGKGEISIAFSDVKANERTGSARWTATYRFSKTNREVVNRVYSVFEFEDGLIRKQTDEFDFWKWSKQALGLSGTLFGWTGFMQRKIRQEARQGLDKFRSTTY